jgi:hypothetical protein
MTESPPAYATIAPALTIAQARQIAALAMTARRSPGWTRLPFWRCWRRWRSGGGGGRER